MCGNHRRSTAARFQHAKSRDTPEFKGLPPERLPIELTRNEVRVLFDRLDRDGPQGRSGSQYDDIEISLAKSFGERSRIKLARDELRISTAQAATVTVGNVDRSEE